MSTWLLAFFLHSTLWFGLAWLSTRLLPKMHPQTRETVWYTAIAASLVTPSVHLMGSGSLQTFWNLTFPGALFSSFQPAVLLGEHGTPAQVGGSGFPWEALLLGIWISTAALLLLRYSTKVLLLRNRLARHDVAPDSREAITLWNLCRRADLHRVPRLTESENLGSPIAIGIGTRAEICVPTRAFHELDPAQFSAMLGHELAHIKRLDPIRLGLMNLLHNLFFFQPLLRVAGRDVHWAAEEQCDEWSADHVDDRLAVARCLTEVAGWVLPQERRFPAVGMAQGRSHLVRRVDRLMEGKNPSGILSRLLRGIGSTSVLVIAPWLAPGLTPVAGSPVEAQEIGEYSPPPFSEHEEGAREDLDAHVEGIEGRSSERRERHGPELGNQTDEDHGEEGSERGREEHRDG